MSVNLNVHSATVPALTSFLLPILQVVSAIPGHLDGKSAPGQVPTGSVCYERNGVRGKSHCTAPLLSKQLSDTCPGQAQLWFDRRAV